MNKDKILREIASDLRQYRQEVDVYKSQYIHKGWAKIIEEVLSQPEQPTLTQDLQKRCSDWGVYWRASDAHGVVLMLDQATELLQQALGVEVELTLNIAQPVPPAPEPVATCHNCLETKYYDLQAKYHELIHEHEELKDFYGLGVAGSHNLDFDIDKLKESHEEDCR